MSATATASRAALAASVLVPVLVLGLVTRDGMLWTTDSTIYVAAADNLRDGRGLTTPFVPNLTPYPPIQSLEFDQRVPLTAFPPAYPALIASLDGLLPGEPGARLLVLIGIGLTAAAAWQLLRRLGAPLVVASAAAIAVSTIPAVLASSTWLLTDGLFLGVVMVGLCALTSPIPERDQARWIGILTAVGTVLTLLRFTGWAFVGTALLIVWFRLTGRRRLLGCAVVAGVPLAATGAWMAATAAAGASGRQAVWHPPGWFDLRVALETTGGLLPRVESPGLRQTLGALLATAAVVVVVATLVRVRERAKRQLVSTVALFAVGYLLLMLLARCFIDETVSLQTRFTLPVAVPLAIVAIGVATRRAAGARAIAGAASVLVAALVLAGTPSDAWANVPLDRTAEVLADPSRLPIGGSPERADYCPAAAGGTVFTNSPERYFSECREASAVLPPRWYVYSGETNHDLAAHLREIDRIAARQAVTIVSYGRTAFVDIGVLPVEEVRRRFPWPVAFDDGGRVLVLRSPR